MPPTPSPSAYVSPWVNDEIRMFRKTARRFIREEFVPNEPRWREQHRPDAEAWRRAGETGMLLTDVPEQYGGGGGTFAHEAVVLEELAYAGVNFGSGVHSIVAHYLLAYGTEAQKKCWLPRMAAGELVGAIAMSEPVAGSDLQAIRTTARRDGDQYVISGSKTFITLLSDPSATAGFDHVIFDTAPTGHTLRLLKLPGAWTGFIDSNTTGTSCLGPLAGLQAQRNLYGASPRALTDSEKTMLVQVTPAGTIDAG